MLWTLTLAGPVASRADIQSPGRSSFPGERGVNRQGDRPPNAVPTTAGVVQGGTVTIILRARGHSGEMVDFLIRTPPEHGTLDAAPRQITLSSASITYTPRPGDDALEDSFTYAVQTRNSPVSAEARVVVRIQEPPPSLACSPAELDFGTVKAGESTRAEVTLTNQGGGEATGRLDPPAPWVVDGPASYRLPRGASQTFALVFKPFDEHTYAEALHFRYETGGGVRLVGTGFGGKVPGKPTDSGGALAGGPAALRPGLAGGDGTAGALTPMAADGSHRSSDPGAPVPVAGSTNHVNTTPGEPLLESGGGPTMPLTTDLTGVESDGDGVPAFNILARGRTTLDLSWRALTPPPKSYRVELRYLSLDSDDKLIVQWQPYARVEFTTAHGFVNARLTGLPPDSQECVRIVAVDTAGRLATPSPLRVVYTLPAATWWHLTPLKVLFALLLLCGGLVLRNRLEVRQVLRELDESRRHREA